MSSIVSRRPPFCGSVSHSNERRWISIRLGTSHDLFRRAKVRRVRRASAAAKEDSFEERDDTTSAKQRKASATRQDSTRHRHPQVGSQRSRTPPPENRVCGAVSIPLRRLRLSASERDSTGKSADLLGAGKDGSTGGPQGKHVHRGPTCAHARARTCRAE